MNTCTHARHVIKVIIINRYHQMVKENNHHIYFHIYIEYSKSIRYAIIILRGIIVKIKKIYN